MAAVRPSAFERAWLWLLSPRGQFVCFVASGVLLALCVWLDGLARGAGRRSILAPTQDDLWNGIEIGAVAGAAVVGCGLLRRLLRLRVVIRDGEQNSLKRCWFVLLYAGPTWVAANVIVLCCSQASLLPVPPILAQFLVGYPGFQLLRLFFADDEPTAEAVQVGK